MTPLIHLKQAILPPLIALVFACVGLPATTRAQLSPAPDGGSATAEGNSHLLAAETANLPSLAGSWQFTLIATGPQASPAVIPVPALATFTSDGSMVETDATEVVPTFDSAGTAVYGTPGHGIWQPGPAVGNLFIQFISLFVNGNTTLHAKKIVTITGALDSTGNRFSGNYHFELVDPTAHIITTGSGTVTGQKIPHPLLP